MTSEYFNPLLGEVCWGIDWDPQLNLSMNFGRPHLRVREPRETESKFKRIRDLYARRVVTLRGDWWLWIFCAYWKLSIRGKVAARGSSTPAAIKRALHLLKGQRLASVTIDPRNGRTSLEFDLGASLEVRRFDNSGDSDMWLLYKPRNRVLSVRGNGTYSHLWGNQPAKHRAIR